VAKKTTQFMQEVEAWVHASTEGRLRGRAVLFYARTADAGTADAELLTPVAA